MTEPQPPQVGKYCLFDRIMGPLPSGTYKFNIHQDLNLGNNSGTSSKHVEVTGPRWSLELSEVHSVYPPQNEQDAPTGCYMPFITLQRRTLPWERLVFIENEQPSDYYSWDRMSNEHRDYPWMALLLLTEEELTNNGILGLFKGADGLKLVNDNVAGESGVFKHWSSNKRQNFGINNDIEDMLVDAIKVKSNTLKKIAPTLDELLLLAHARQVNPLDKENCGTDEDGWFSIVMSNRVLKPSTTYHACLVSLEGRLSENILPKNPANNSTVPRPKGTVKTEKPTMSKIGKAQSALQFLLAVPKLPFVNKSKSSKSGTNKGKTTKSQRGGGTSMPNFTRLVLLNHWTFKSSEVAGDFQTRVESLGVRVRSSTNPEHNQGDVIPISDVKDDEDVIEPLLLGNESTPGMTANSFLTTQMQHSDGIPEDVLYRGPLTAFPENHVPKEKPYPDSDAALAVVEELGIWDISHSSAFELGRLLALSDARFTKAMKRWVSIDIQQAMRAKREEQIESRLLRKEDLENHLTSIVDLDNIRLVRDPQLERGGFVADVNAENVSEPEESIDSNQSLGDFYNSQNNGAGGGN